VTVVDVQHGEQGEKKEESRVLDYPLIAQQHFSPF
jgi:hypothetical protein